MKPIQGIHHITVMASDPQRNIDFFHKVLGQRFIKKTVNFDDPGTYHLYYGDEVGTPGTIMTYFPWVNAKRGTRGNGETGAVAYSIPTSAVPFWQKRLADHDIVMGETETRFGATVIPFHDPDGLPLELITYDNARALQFWANGPISETHGIRGFYGVTLWVDKSELTGQVLSQRFGYEKVGQEGDRTRYASPNHDVGAFVDLLERPGAERGRMGAGSVHHVAFRNESDSEQVAYLADLRAHGFGVTDVKDRQYFHSIYFREPNGVLFEVATDAPGFLYDEAREHLGRALRLPPWQEHNRTQIEKILPPVVYPDDYS